MTGRYINERCNCPRRGRYTAILRCVGRRSRAAATSAQRGSLQGSGKSLSSDLRTHPRHGVVDSRELGLSRHGARKPAAREPFFGRCTIDAFRYFRRCTGIRRLTNIVRTEAQCGGFDFSMTRTTMAVTPLMQRLFRRPGVRGSRLRASTALSPLGFDCALLSHARLLTTGESYSRLWADHLHQ